MSLLELGSLGYPWLVNQVFPKVFPKVFPCFPVFRGIRLHREGGYTGHTPKPDMDLPITYTIDPPKQSCTYYHGKLKFNGADSVDVSFMPFENSMQVAQIFERSKKVSHDRVMRPWFFTYDHSIGKHVVCYDRFTAFLPENSPSWLSQPLESSDIPGLPNPTLQREIRELAMGLEHLHNNEVSHSALNSAQSYVWSNDKIKIININDSKFDFWDKVHPSESEQQWQGRKRLHINQFSKGLAYLLKSKSNWPEKDSFLSSFKLNVSPDRYLKMVYTHPFLMEHMKKILQLFADAHHAYMSQDGGGLKVDLLKLAFQQNFLSQEYLKSGVGWRRQMSTEFTNIIQHTTPSLPQSSGSPLSTSTGGSLRRYSSNRAPAPPLPYPSKRRPHLATGNTGHQSYAGTSQPSATGHPPYAGTSQSFASIYATTPTTSTLLDRYKTNDMSELLRFLRNVFEHYYEHKMSLSSFYEEVRKHWPHFVDRIHEKV